MCHECTVHARAPRESHIDFLGAFACAAAEQAFRRRHERYDLWMSRVCVIAGMTRVAVFFASDYNIFGAGTLFLVLVACRCLFILMSAGVLMLLGRLATPARREGLFFSWCVLHAGMTLAFYSIRPPEYSGLALLSVATVLAAYSIAPLSLARQALLAVPLSIATFALALRGEGDGLTLRVLAFALLMSNVLGAVVSWRLHHHRREAFRAAERESGLRLQLEQALADVKTLRGVLSICAWCKRIRNETEAWQRVEDYVKAHSNAEFTHGICPQCLGDQLRDNAAGHRTDQPSKKS